MLRTSPLWRTCLAAVAVLAFATAADAAPKKVVIANFGPHGSLDQVVEGVKQGLKDKGYVEGQTVTYDYGEVGFDPSLVPQLLAKMEAEQPDLMVTITTPVSQAAVKLVRNQSLPIVFASVTDPVAAGLVPSWDHGSARFVGASNMQDMGGVIDFGRKLLGEVKSFGMLYDPGCRERCCQHEFGGRGGEGGRRRVQAGGRRCGRRDRSADGSACRRRLHLRDPVQPADAGASGDRVGGRPDEGAGHQLFAARSAGRVGAGLHLRVLDAGGLSGGAAGSANSGRRQARPARELQARGGRRRARHQRQTAEGDGQDAAPGAGRLSLA